MTKKEFHSRCDKLADQVRQQHGDIDEETARGLLAQVFRVIPDIIVNETHPPVAMEQPQVVSSVETA